MAGTVRMAKVDAQKLVAPRDPEKDLDALRTRLAQKFVSLADTVADAFSDFHIGAGDWVVELTAPEGMSTGGGKQALQHFRLRPRRQGYSVIVGGAVNQVTKTAELRDWDFLEIQHQVRFRKHVEISIGEWEQFLRQAEVVLQTATIASKRVGPPRELRDEREKMRRVSRIAVGVLAAVGVLVAFVAWRVVVTVRADKAAAAGANVATELAPQASAAAPASADPSGAPPSPAPSTAPAVEP